ncbi:MAG TPA: TetR/AcrR family transcriptional regulator [Micromonosporaceae bacterium]|jgi:AcrR family transcriptional regulator
MTEPTGRIDGRTARAVRTRSAIVDAHLALLRDGDLRPTGERIAERAGVSLRTLWTNFKDMETLFAAAGRRLIEIQLEEYEPISPSLPLPDRVDRFCRQRARMLEILAPAARAAVTREPFSAQLRRNRAIEISRVSEEIATLFEAELKAGGADADDLRDALVTTVTYASWSVLREQLSLSPERAGAVMRRAVAALLDSK